MALQTEVGPTGLSWSEALLSGQEGTRSDGEMPKVLEDLGVEQLRSGRWLRVALPAG